MRTFEFIIELLVGIGSVIGLAISFTFIGREFGTIRKFFDHIIEKMKEKINPNNES